MSSVQYNVRPKPIKFEEFTPDTNVAYTLLGASSSGIVCPVVSSSGLTLGRRPECDKFTFSPRDGGFSILTPNGGCLGKRGDRTSVQGKCDIHNLIVNRNGGYKIANVSASNGGVSYLNGNTYSSTAMIWNLS